MTSLRNMVLHALLWSGLGQFARQGVTLIIGIILARLLSPAEFGLLAMVVMLTGFAELFMEFGLGSALVQHQDPQPRHFNAVFWATLLVGSVMTGLFMMIASMVAVFYEQPILEAVTLVLALNFPLVAGRCVPYALLARDMNFRVISMAELTATVLSGVVAIVMAVNGFALWALVIQILLRNALLTALLWIPVRWTPRISLSPAALREMLAFSVHVLGYQSTNYWSMRVDQFLIGRFLGAVPLGLYAKSVEVMMLPVRQIGAMATRVMFPAFSKIQDDPSRIKAIYLQSLGCIALVAFPLILGLGVAADSIIPALLGPKWVDTIPLIRILCLIGAFHAIGTTTSWIYMSRGRTGLMFSWGMFVAVMKTLAFIIGLRWGVQGVAWSFFAVNIFILLYPNFAIPGRLIGMTFADVWRAVRAPLWMSLLMCGVVYAVGRVLPSDASQWMTCLVQVTTGGAFYWLLVHHLRVKPYQVLQGVVRERFPSVFAKATPVA